MNIPERLPKLIGGKGLPGSGEICAEQAVNWLVSGHLDLGDETDHPDCVQPVLNTLAIKVNDTISDERRHEMWPILLRQPGTAHPDMEPILSIRLACFLAEKVLYLVPEADWEVCRDAIVAAQVYCDNPTKESAYAAAAAAAYANAAANAAAAAAYANAAANAAANATYAAADIANAANVAAYAAAANATYAAYANATYAAYANAANAAYAAAAAYNAAYGINAKDDALLSLLREAQEECERLTGHVPQTCDVERIERLIDLVGVV
jgi:hypothetical protein